jgi:hypothetical protein
VDVQGARAMVGAPSPTQQGGSAGAAYVFEITAGAWTEAARIDAPQNGSSELFGISVSLDGERALLGAPTSSLVTQIGGAAYLVRRGSGSWASPTAIVRTTIAPADGYGRFVLLRGAKAFVGSPDADFAATDAGAVHVINVTGR